MLVNGLVIAFVSAFIAIAAFGHVLLVTAIWPNLLQSRRESASHTVADTTGQLNQPS